MHKDKRGYFYKSRRVAGRAEREYVGGASSYRLQAEIKTQYERSLENEDRQRHRRDADELDKLIIWLCDETTVLMHNALEKSGWHRRKRGHWRKRHKSKRGIMEKQTTAQIEKLRAKAEIVATATQLKELIRRGKSGDKAASERFFELSDAKPDGGLVQYGDIARIAQEFLLKRICGKDLILHGSMERNMAAMAQELAGDTASPLEMMLAQRVAITHFHLHYCENIAVLNFGNESWTPDDEKVSERRTNAASKRHLSACKALAQVQRLQLPDVQVNVGTLNAPAARENQTLAALGAADDG